MTKVTKLIIFLLLLYPFLSSGSTGAGTALQFQGSEGNYAELGNLPLGEESFTVEMWINTTSVTGDPAFFSNKDWGSGNNTGFNVFMQGDGQYKVNYKAEGSSRVDISSGESVVGSWKHIAIVVDRDGEMVLYVNGVATNSADISGTVGTLDGDYPFNIGQDGTGTYNHNYNGFIDEVRVWSSVRSESELRTSMCQKLSGTEAGLLAYYTFNAGSGGTAQDMAGNGYDAILSGNEANAWQTSGAAIGDEAVFVYDLDGTEELNLTSAATGEVSLHDISTELAGVQLYRVDEAPANVVGFELLEGESAYYGVFPVGTGNYQFSYSYGNWPEALNAGTSFGVFSRIDATSASWEAQAGAIDDANDIFESEPLTGQSEVIGGAPVDGSCGDLTAVDVTDISIVDATVSWEGQSDAVTVVYGEAGFEIENGTLLEELTGSSTTLSGLLPETNYEVYVRNICFGLDAGAWFGPVSFSTNALPSAVSTGAGTALQFIGSDANYAELGNLPLGEESFTVEMWINTTSVTGDPAFFSNKDWNSGNNTGFNIFMQGNGQYRVNYKTADSPRIDVSSEEVIEGSWKHIAVVVDRAGEMVLYVNGVATNSVDVSATEGTIEGTLPFNLAQDGTGNYGSKYDGYIDEVRVWNTVRTETELRNTMCAGLSGDEDGLLAYWDFNESAGPVAADGTANAYEATLMGNVLDAWQLSGAAIGNESVFVYNPVSTDVLSLTSAANGSVNIQEISTDLAGIQLYRIDGSPLQIGGFEEIDGENAYYGIYPVGSGDYSFQYDYNAWPAAVALGTDFNIFSRSDVLAETWVSPTGNLDQDLSVFNSASLTGRREVIGGINLVGECPAPTDFALVNAGFYNAEISWVPGSSDFANISYGPAGISPDEGTLINYTDQNPFLVDGLNPGTAYHFFVQDSCLGIGSSQWVGPLEINTPNLDPSFVNGSGTAFEFDGNNWMSLGTPDVLKPEEQLTVEAWINPNEFTQSWTGILFYGQDNGSDESGYGLVHHNGKLRAYFMPENYGGNSWNSAPGAAVPIGQWSHVAASYDGESLKFYLNGVLMEEQTTSGNMNWEFDPVDFRFGTFYDDNEDVRYNGKLDEVRIWDTARSIEDIQADMCRKLEGDEANLIGYWSFNEGFGAPAAIDQTANGNDAVTGGTTVAESWIYSGAHIGDESTSLYGAELSGQSLSLGSSGFGEVVLNNFQENTEGVQIYRVDANPNTVDFPLIADGASHFGVFPVSDAPVAAQYNYGGFPEAQANANELILLTRANSGTDFWTALNAVNDPENSTFAFESGQPQQIYPIVDANPCALPTGAGFTDQEISSVNLVWDAVEGATYDVVYLNAGESIDSGMEVFGLTANNLLLEGLQANSNFAYYLRVNCDDESSSYWLGPVAFETLQCMPPENFELLELSENAATVTWEGGSSDTYSVQWGLEGFPFGFGIETTVTELPFEFTSLSANTTYEWFVRTTCDEWGESIWMGPFTFTTEDPNSVSEVNKADAKLYPNPSADVLNIESNLFQGDALIKVYGVSGRLELSENHAAAERIQLYVGDLAPGVYMVAIETNEGRLHTRFVKN